MNVAMHLCQLGAKVAFISKVGEDQEGKDLLKIVRDKGLSTDFVQIDTHHPTGKVIVDESDKENIRYDIVKPAAWDHIGWYPSQQEIADHAKVFIFGSLAARGEISRATLLKLLMTPALKVMDINLRAPFYSFELLDKLISHSDVLKLNEEELNVMAGFHQYPRDRETALVKLAEHYDLSMICLTLGKNGAWLYYEEEFVQHPGYQVQVKDTVGSGDAFLSAFIYSHLMNKSPEQMLDDACALGAYVATQEGGTPSYKQEDIEKIKSD